MKSNTRAKRDKKPSTKKAGREFRETVRFETETAAAKPAPKGRPLRG